MKPIKIVSFVTLCLLSFMGVSAKTEKEPEYRIRDTHVLEVPISNKEMDNWQTFNGSIMLKNNIVLSPEVKNAKGGIMNLVPLKPRNEFIIDIHV